MILNEFFNLPQVFEKDMTEDQSQYTDMTVAQQVFKDNPDIDHEDDILNAAFPYVVKLVGSRKRANYMFNYDEDFPGDLISAYRFLQRDQHDVGLEEGMAEGIFGSRPSPVLPIVDKISKVARGLTPQNVETGKQIIQANVRDIQRILSPQSKAGVDVIEAKGDYVPPKEADYGPEYQAMVKRVGQKARAQEKAKQQPKQPVRESRRALLKRIIQS